METPAIELAKGFLDTTANLPWGIMLAAFLGSGVATTITNWLLSNLTTRKADKAKTKFLSNNLAVQYERFAIMLANGINDDQAYSQTYGTPNPEQGTPLMRIPNSPKIVSDSSYELLDDELRDRILRFEDDIAVINLRLSSASEVLDGDEVNELAVTECKKIGKSAISLSKDLRSKSDLQKRSLKFGDWDIVEQFE